MPVKPTIAGNQLTFTVPMEALPPLGLYQQFGTSAVVDGVDGRVIDDCSSLTTAPTVG